MLRRTGRWCAASVTWSPDGSRPGRSGPRWRARSTRSSGNSAASPRSAVSAAKDAAPDSPIARPRAASVRIAARVSASETVTVPRMPGRERRPRGRGDDRAVQAGHRGARRRDLDGPPGFERRGQARGDVRLGAEHRDPGVRAPAGGGGAQRADADRHDERVVGVGLELVEERRVAVDHPRRRPVGADVGELEAAGLRARGSGQAHRVLVGPVDDHDLRPLPGDRLAPGGHRTGGQIDAGAQPAPRGHVRDRAPVVARAGGHQRVDRPDRAAARAPPPTTRRAP